MIEQDNRIVIQAKPLTLKTFEEEDFDRLQTYDETKMTIDEYLDRAFKEKFKEEEGAVNLQPEIDIREKISKIQLPCNEVQRINNTFNAPIVKKQETTKKKTAPGQVK